MRYGDRLWHLDETTYEVQTTYPGSRDNEFTAYSRWAYVHKDDPGNGSYSKSLFHRYPELLKEMHQGGFEAMRFRSMTAAFECARIIREEAHLKAGYEGTEDWRVKYRGPIQARVVEVHDRRSAWVIEES